MRDRDSSNNRKRAKESIKCFEVAIISGSKKGKKILIPDINTTRSSKTILRESLFNTLQFDIIDKNFVEVFAGSGSVGLEALSRGASHCYFMEYNKTAFRCLESNIKNTDPSRCTTFYGDSFENFANVYNIVKKTGRKTYFYFDPPFSTRDGMDDIYDKTISLIESIEPEVCEMVTVEHMTNLDMPKELGELKRVKRKKFGRSTMSYYAPKSS